MIRNGSLQKGKYYQRQNWRGLLMHGVLDSLSTSLMRLVDISCSNDQTTEYVVNVLNTYTEKIISDPLKGLKSIEAIPRHMSPEQMPPPPVFMGINQMNMPPLSDDKEKVKKLLAGFDPNTSEAWMAITDRFTAQIKQPPLLQMAMKMGASLNIDISRQARRRRSVLIKWFHDNWATVGKYIDHFKLEGDTIVMIKDIQ